MNERVFKKVHISMCRLYMLSTLVLETNVSHWDSPSELETWPVNSWNSPLLQENGKGGCLGLNLGLHACAVRTLPTKPSPKPQLCFLRQVMNFLLKSIRSTEKVLLSNNGSTVLGLHGRDL